MISLIIRLANCVEATDKVNIELLEPMFDSSQNRWVLGNSTYNESEYYIFYSCSTREVCGYYNESINNLSELDLRFIKIKSDFSFNNFSFTYSYNRTYHFSSVLNYSDIFEPIQYFYGNATYIENLKDFQNSSYITIVSPYKNYNNMRRLSDDLYGKIGFVNVITTNSTKSCNLWNPYEKRFYEFAGTEETFISTLNRNIYERNFKRLMKYDEIALIFTNKHPTRTELNIMHKAMSVFPKLRVMFGNQIILHDLSYLAVNSSVNFVLLYPSHALFSVIQKKDYSRLLKLAERQIKDEIKRARAMMNESYIQSNETTQKLKQKIDCSGRNPFTVPAQLYYGPPLTDRQFDRSRCFIKQNLEGDNFSQPFYVVGSNNTWFNLILPTNISRRVSQDEFWNKFSNLTYNLTEHIPWNEFGPEMPHYKEILFDHEGNQINKTFKINLLNSTDKYFHGGADRANFKDLTESIQKQLKYKYIYKPMHPFERLIFNWLYSACNSTSWYPLSVPSNQDSIFNTLPAYKHLNSGSFGSFYTGEYDKCILFYDSSATSELMHYLFSKVASLANQTHSFPDLKFGAINVDLNYAQFMPRNISAPLVMKSRVPFVAVLPQQWYGFKPFIVNDPSKIDTILSKYQGRQRYSHPVNAAPYIFNETLWNPIYYNLLLKKFKFLSKKHTFEKSPSGKSWITNEVFYWSLQFYRQKYF